MISNRWWEIRIPLLIRYALASDFINFYLLYVNVFYQKIVAITNFYLLQRYDFFLTYKLFLRFFIGRYDFFCNFAPEISFGFYVV